MFMKFIRFACGVLLLTGVAAGDARAAGPLAVSLPSGFGDFSTQSQKTPSPEGDIRTTNWIARAPSGDVVILTESAMPARVLDPEKLLAGNRRSLLTSLSATLESEQKIDVPRPSRGFLFRNAAMLFRARAAVVGDRLYQLLFVTRAEDRRSAAETERLFDSFVAALPERSE